MVFPVVVYGCESWTIKKAKCQRIDAFELWCWGRLLRVLWTARRLNQSILKENSPEYSLEGLMMKLKLQYFGQNWLTGKDPDAGKDWRWEEEETTEDEMVGWHHQLDVSVSSSSWWWTGKLGVLQSMGVAKSQTWLSDWTEWLAYLAFILLKIENPKEHVFMRIMSINIYCIRN